MIKIEQNMGVGRIEMEGTIKTLTCELSEIFDNLAERHEDIFLAALILYEAGRGDDNDDNDGID